MAKATTRKTTKKAVAPIEPVAPREEPALDIATRDEEGRTPLHLAAKFGYASTVRRLLQQEAEADARDHGARTPGHWPAFKGYLDVVKLLVEFGADINARDDGGRTLLSMAIIGKQDMMEAYLRNHGGTV